MGSTPNTPYRSAPLQHELPPDRDVRLEVSARWGDEVLAVAHLRPGERFALAARAAWHRPGVHVLVHPMIEGDAWTFARHYLDGRCEVCPYAETRASQRAHPEELTGEDVFEQQVGDVHLVARRVRVTDERTPRGLVGARSGLVLALAGALFAGAVAAFRVPAIEARWTDVPGTFSTSDARVLRALVARWSPAREVTPTSTTAPVVEHAPRRYALRAPALEPPHLRCQAWWICERSARSIFTPLGEAPRRHAVPRHTPDRMQHDRRAAPPRRHARR